MKNQYQALSETYFDLAQTMHQRIENANDKAEKEKLSERRLHYLEQYLSYSNRAKEESVN